MKRALLSTWLLALWLGSAAGQSTQREPAQLILFREKEFISRLGKAYVFKINGQPMGKLSPNRFVQLPIVAGRIKLEFVSDFFTDSRPLWIQVQPGQTYYVKAAVEVDFLSAMMVMALVDSQQAHQELLRMKPEVIQPAQQPE